MIINLYTSLSLALMKGQGRKKQQPLCRSPKFQKSTWRASEYRAAESVRGRALTCHSHLLAVQRLCAQKCCFLCEQVLWLLRRHRGPSFLALLIRSLFSEADKTSPSFKYSFGRWLQWQWWRLIRVSISPLWIWISARDIWKLLLLTVFKLASLEMWNYKMINQFVVANLEDSRLPPRLRDLWIHPQHCTIIFLFFYSIKGQLTFRSETPVL